MDLYPIDLVLAAALAWATVFFAALPTRILAARVFLHEPARFGVAWLLVAALAPPAILHFHLALGLVCFYAWRRLRHENRLRAKAWLSAAAGLGLALGVTLILAVTPRAWPPGIPLLDQTLRLAALHLGGAVIGLAVMLHAFTRRESTQAGFPLPFLQACARLLVILTLLRAAVLIGTYLLDLHPTHHLAPGNILGQLLLLLLPLLAYVAQRRILSPAPSTSAVPLFALYVVAFLAEVVVRI